MARAFRRGYALPDHAVSSSATTLAITRCHRIRNCSARSDIWAVRITRRRRQWLKYSADTPKTMAVRLDADRVEGLIGERQVFHHHRVADFDVSEVRRNSVKRKRRFGVDTHIDVYRPGTDG